MQYDPIKKSLGKVFNKSPFLRKLFYRLLNLLLLRTWHIHRQLRIWAKDKRQSAKHILDAGSGFGQYSYKMAKMSKKWQITAVDVKEEQVEDCNNFFTKIGLNDRVKFSIEDLVHYQRPDTYDLVLSVDVMEHILEDVDVFKNFAVSLKKGGVLLISTPSDQGGSDVHGDEESSFIEEHVRDGYNKEEITQKILSAGFSKVKVGYSYGAPGKISWRFSMKYPIVMLGKSKLFFIILPFYYLLFYPGCLILNWLDVRQNHKTGTGLIVVAEK